MSSDKIPAPWGAAKPAGTQVIAITGTIAAGKSTLGNILAEKGWKVIDADKDRAPALPAGRGGVPETG